MQSCSHAGLVISPPQPINIHKPFLILSKTYITIFLLATWFTIYIMLVVSHPTRYSGSSINTLLHLLTFLAIRCSEKKTKHFCGLPITCWEITFMISSHIFSLSFSCGLNWGKISVSALATLADIPDDLYTSAAVAIGSWTFCWCRKKECSRMRVESANINCCHKVIWLKLTNASLESLFPGTKWEVNLQNDIEWIYINPMNILLISDLLIVCHCLKSKYDIYGLS